MGFAIEVLTERLKETQNQLKLYEELVEVDAKWVKEGVNADYYSEKLSHNQAKVKDLRERSDDLQNAIAHLNGR